MAIEGNFVIILFSSGSTIDISLLLVTKTFPWNTATSLAPFSKYIFSITCPLVKSNTYILFVPVTYKYLSRLVGVGVVVGETGSFHHTLTNSLSKISNFSSSSNSDLLEKNSQYSKFINLFGPVDPKEGGSLQLIVVSVQSWVCHL